MYKRILVPTDGSRLSMKAVKGAARLAKSLGASMTAVYAIQPYVPTYYGEAMIYLPQKGRAIAKRAATKALKELERLARAAGVNCATVTIESGAPWEGILRVAKSKRSDLIVMASHGRRGLSGLLLGSETAKVLTHSKIPVLVCR